MSTRINRIMTFLIAAMFVASCTESYSPKPRGYFRIALPEKSYQIYEGGCPFVFQYPIYGEIVRPVQQHAAHHIPDCWMDIIYPEFNARLHLSYLPIKSREDLFQMAQDAHTLAFQHTARATSILQVTLHGDQPNVNGLLYEIKGNTASNLQFFLTDSVHHYVRGALYFREKPRADSIQPVLDFLREDMDVFVKSFRWK